MKTPIQNCRDACEYALSRLKAGGADMAQCRASGSIEDETNVESGALTLQRTLFDASISLKALVGGRKGVVALNRFDRASLDRAAEDCLAAARASEPDEAEGIAEYAAAAHFESGELNPDREALCDRVEEFMASVSDRYPKVVLRTLAATCDRTDEVFLNSNGVDFSYSYGYYGFSSMYSAREGDLSSSFGGYYTCADTLGRPFLELGMQQELLAESERQIHTSPFAGKLTGPVILTPDCLQGFLQMAFSSFTSDTNLIEKTSPWRDKLGEAVASPRLSVALRPLDRRIVCGERYTGDGYTSADAQLIERGTLKSFTLSRYGAARTGLPRCRNSSSSLVVEPGDAPLSEMVAGIGRGLVVGRFSGGMPQANGDFSGVAKNSFLIENGAISRAVSETMISGNLALLLKNVAAISSETVSDGLTVLPWLLADGVTIVGK